MAYAVVQVPLDLRADVSLLATPSSCAARQRSRRARSSVQPISLTYVHGHEFRRRRCRYIRSLTAENRSVSTLLDRGKQQSLSRPDATLDRHRARERVRFFITSLGESRSGFASADALGGVVYHDVTERKWAQKGIEGGGDARSTAIDDVNADVVKTTTRSRCYAPAGTGAPLYPKRSSRSSRPFGKPIVQRGRCGHAGRVCSGSLRLGYAAVELGTRFIATPECQRRATRTSGRSVARRRGRPRLSTGASHALLSASPLSATPYVERLGTKAGRVRRAGCSKGRKTKHWMRTWYARKLGRDASRSLLIDRDTSSEYWQAGTSARAAIHDARKSQQSLNRPAEIVAGGRRRATFDASARS